MYNVALTVITSNDVASKINCSLNAVDEISDFLSRLNEQGMTITGVDISSVGIVDEQVC